MMARRDPQFYQEVGCGVAIHKLQGAIQEMKGHTGLRPVITRSTNAFF